jgi:hypothetical protein
MPRGRQVRGEGEGSVTRPLSVFLMIALLFMPGVAAANECGDAVRDYNAVIGHLEDAMQKFQSCVANSLGRDGCAAEYARLRSAYGEFESAVAIYRKQCV